jgi:hypothetical protein
MSDYERTNPEKTTPARPVAGGTSTPPAATYSGRSRVRRLLSNSRRRWIAAAALMCAVIALVVGLASSQSASARQSVASSAPAGGPLSGGTRSNARSGPAAGGASGTVATVSAWVFTLTTSAGQKVTVDKASSTRYEKGTSSISASAITKGARVLVLGTTSGTMITAKQVIVQSAGGSAPASSATVVPFKRGAPSTAKTAGKIPASYSEGSGTIVSGTAANKATEVALVSYPGGVVDRVVSLSNGEYEVHNIGVNWPHHIFVSKDYKVVGAE